MTTDVGTQYNPTDCVTDPVPGTSVQTIATNDSGSSDSENSDHLDCNKVHSSDYTATSSEDDTYITVSDTEEMCTAPVDQQKFIVFSNNLDSTISLLQQMWFTYYTYKQVHKRHHGLH